ncbi:hypothetical protein [Sphingomonas sp. PAMC 26621]|uniref:hypothetical protein n=1 Tax=Sphingomonas sp. PAMC 26621 TaxID=1112213 RepID=UPI0002881C13|nr:hypothetical protein [Sphingomonas sp. PAMC 26621]
MVGVLLGLAVVELLVVHLVIVGLFGTTAAIVVGALDLAVVVGLVLLLRSFRRLPVTLDDRVLTLRAGSLKRIAVPTSSIAGLRTAWDAAALKRPGVVNLALASWPNVFLDLSEPMVLRSGKPIHAVAHKLDDPAAFHAAISALSAAHGY